MLDGLKALVRDWDRNARYHESAAQDIRDDYPSEDDPPPDNDAHEADLNAEAARVYRVCADALHAIIKQGRQ